MQNLNEMKEFLMFFFEGILINFLFDFFRGIRNNFKSGDFATLVEDVIFLSFASIVILFSIIYICGGIFRMYMLLAVASGIAVYSLTISKRCVIIITSNIKIFKSFFTFLLKIVKKLGNLF